MRLVKQDASLLLSQKFVSFLHNCLDNFSSNIVRDPGLPILDVEKSGFILIMQTKASKYN